MGLPRLYAILDAGWFSAAAEARGDLLLFARELLAGGVTLLQYRNKQGSARAMLGDARELTRLCHLRAARLIINDRVDICLAAGADGIHLGQDDVSPQAVARILTTAERGAAELGLSTHNQEQVAEAESGPATYVAIGPVFPTATKLNPEPVVGLQGVRQARALTRKPLVAIGGITRENCAQVMDAGADSVAVISELRAQPRKTVEEFLRVLG